MTAIALPGSTGDANLRKARFFLDEVRRAEQADSFDREAVEAYLSAAIVFGKSTQDWMADQYGGATRKAREAWLQGTSLWNDPLCKLFANTRDIVVHDDGSVELFERTSVTVYASAGFAVASGGYAVAQAIPPNPKPWSRAKLWWDHRRALAKARRQQRERDKEVQRLIAEHRAEAENHSRAHPPKRVTRAHFTHSDPQVADRPAIEVVRNYLDHLERVLVSQQPPSTTAN